jgi:hypothetical protein
MVTPRIKSRAVLENCLPGFGKLGYTFAFVVVGAAGEVFLEGVEMFV